MSRQSKDSKRWNRAKSLIAQPIFRARRESAARGRGSYTRKIKHKAQTHD